MNGAIVGLVFGVGALLLYAALTSPAAPRSRSGASRRIEDLVARAGVPGFGAGRLVGLCGASGLIGVVLIAGFSRSAVLGLAAGLAAAYAPVGLLRRRARQRSVELRTVWPDVVDNLASAVRAGLALPDALAQIGDAGPPAIAPVFARFAADYRTSGRFGDCLDALKERLADPVADRIVESLRLAREVGGSDLGTLLRGLSVFLRDDARTRAELETRQGWTVNAAKLAAAAPWITVVLLSARPEAVRAYDTPAGVAVLVIGAVVTFVAYRLMIQLGRLPEDVRVLR